MSKRKRAKKYNPMKDALLAARRGLKDLAIWHSELDRDNDYTAELINYKQARSITVGQSMAHVLTKVRHKWNVHLLAIGIESNGKSRFEVDEVPITEPLLQADLVEYLDWRHKEFAKEFEQRNKLTNVAWLAVPNGEQITNEQIDEILTKFKGWG
jgi:hypothetical protein